MVLLKHVFRVKVAKSSVELYKEVFSACIQMLLVVEKFPFIEGKSPK